MNGYQATRCWAAINLLLALTAPSALVGQITTDGLFATIYTPKGRITIALTQDRTPMTIANFVGLAEGSIRNDAFPLGVPFFDGSTFHRVVPGHVIQGGAPASETAQGPGYRIPNEIDPTLGHGRAGMVGMASSGPHTAGSQFYVTLGDRSYLDGNYAVFGEVVGGMDVVNATVQDDIIDSVRIVRRGAAANAFHPNTETFEALVATVRARVEREAEEKRVAEADYIKRNWPNAVTVDSTWQYVITHQGSGAPPDSGDIVAVRYNGYTLSDKSFVSTAESGQPDRSASRDEPGTEFSFVVGETTIIPALDAAIARLLPGERRVLIVQAAGGYGRSGYYAPERSGPRFVISPETTLIYFVERTR